MQNVAFHVDSSFKKARLVTVEKTGHVTKSVRDIFGRHFSSIRNFSYLEATIHNNPKIFWQVTRDKEVKIRFNKSNFKVE